MIFPTIAQFSQKFKPQKQLDHMSKIIGAVEIGTSSAKALVGEVGESGSLSIVGMATRQNEGMRKGHQALP